MSLPKATQKIFTCLDCARATMLLTGFAFVFNKLEESLPSVIATRQRCSSLLVAPYRFSAAYIASQQRVPA